MLLMHDSVRHQSDYVFASRARTATIRVWSSVMNGIEAFGLKYKHDPYRRSQGLIEGLNS